MLKKKYVIGLILIIVAMSMSYTLIRGQEFVVNTHRVDAYQQSRFRVKWEGRVVPGINRIKGLRRTTKVTTFRQGTEKGAALKIPGETVYEPIILQRGRTHDNAFEQWAAQVQAFGPGSGAQTQPQYRKDIIIELLNEAGQVVMAWHVFGCWPTVYSPVEDLDATSTETAIEMLVLEHNGWERDLSITEPVEQSYTVPN